MNVINSAALPAPTRRSAVALAARKLDAAVSSPADVAGAMASVRSEIASALAPLGYTQAAALVIGTEVVLAALKSLGVAWADQALAQFDAMRAAA